MAQLMSNMNTAVFKLPLGMIRVIEFPMAILAFATTSGYSSSGSIECIDCGKSVPLSFGYPFAMDGPGGIVRQNICDPTTNKQDIVFPERFVSQSEFYVCTGVLSFLYILAIVAFYSLFWHMYENNARFPMIDFAVTAVLSLFWFAGSCAWASGVTGVKSTSGKEAIQIVMKGLSCKAPSGTLDPNMVLHDTWNYASLNVSLIAGFACCGLWIANLWFIYKETAWFKARSGAAGGVGAPQPGMTPNIGSPTSQTGYPNQFH